MLINAYATVQALPPLAFPHERKAQLAGTELAEHLRGFKGFVGKHKMTHVVYGVLRHLERVQHHVAVELPDDQVNAFAAWAQAANAILFLTDATVRAPDGRTLIDPHGLPPTGAVPHPADAVQRAAEHRAALAVSGIPTPASLPPVVGEPEVALRSADEIAGRARGLLAVALRGESLASGEPIPVEDLPEAELTPHERSFMKSPDAQGIIDAAWRYEALHVLAWVLGWVPELPFPSRTCNVKALVGAVGGATTLRAVPEILDALDQTYRLHWATVDARLHDRKLDGVEPGVVVERHHALEWLTSRTAWDDVQTET